MERLPIHRSLLPIASPCQENWDGMHNGGAIRHCDRCDKDVTDLSALTKKRARQVLQQATDSGTELCVRYTCNEGGLVQFQKDTPALPALAGTRGLILAAGLALAAPATAIAVAGLTTMGQVQRPAAPGPVARPAPPAEPSPAPPTAKKPDPGPPFHVPGPTFKRPHKYMGKLVMSRGADGKTKLPF